MAEHYFRLAGLPTVGHSEATKKMLEPQKNKREFVRCGIITYAVALGYDNKEWKTRPSFMLPEEWQQYTELSKNSRRVNYDYLVAFAWLKSKPRFSRVSAGELLRTVVMETKKG